MKPGWRSADNSLQGAWAGGRRPALPERPETVMKSLLFLVVIACSAGCAPKAEKPTISVPLTERQRDSILARSALPGAQVVGRALDISDKSAEHAAAENAAVDTLFH